MVVSRYVFVTGATGYMGRRLLAVLLARGHRVRALARRGSLEADVGRCTRQCYTAVPPSSITMDITQASHS